MCFLQAGVAPADVGVIALYNEQVRLIRDVLTSQQRVSGGGGGGSDVEVNTVDRYKAEHLVNDREKPRIKKSYVKLSERHLTKHFRNLCHILCYKIVSAVIVLNERYLLRKVASFRRR